ncbi:hypothetical protein HAX54_044604, partial [Datura stramonium]|nr:hypothetical protein [Datura stramonium]
MRAPHAWHRAHDTAAPSRETLDGTPVQEKWLQATALNLRSIDASWIVIGDSPYGYHCNLPVFFQAPAVHRCFTNSFLRFAGIASASHFKNSNCLSSNPYNSLS